MTVRPAETHSVPVTDRLASALVELGRYDEATAAAEAMTLAHRAGKHRGPAFFVDAQGLRIFLRKPGRRCSCRRTQHGINLVLRSGSNRVIEPLQIARRDREAMHVADDAEQSARTAVPPAEHEAAYYAVRDTPAMEAQVT